MKKWWDNQKNGKEISGVWGSWEKDWPKKKCIDVIMRDMKKGDG